MPQSPLAASGSKTGTTGVPPVDDWDTWSAAASQKQIRDQSPKKHVGVSKCRAQLGIRQTARRHIALCAERRRSPRGLPRHEARADEAEGVDRVGRAQHAARAEHVLAADGDKLPPFDLT